MSQLLGARPFPPRHTRAHACRRLDESRLLEHDDICIHYPVPRSRPCHCCICLPDCLPFFSPSAWDCIPRSHAASHACCSASSSHEDDAPLPPGFELPASSTSTNKTTATSPLPDAITTTSPALSC